MHAAHPAPVERPPELDSDAPFRPPVADARAPGRAPTCLSLAVLLVACSLALIDGLFGSVVAYERDTVVFYYPLLAWVSQQLHQGVLPLWAPQFFGGYPIFADGEIGLAYPPLLLALLTLPPDRAFIMLRLAHLLLAAVGCYALARAWGLTYAASTLAGLTFALGSFLQAQAHHENIVRTAAWLPVILALVERALRRQGGARLRWTGGAGLALGLAGLSLHSQVLAIELLALGAYALFRWCIGPIRGPSSGLFGRPRAVLSVFAPVVVLGLGLAAVQLVPLIELASFSPRGSGISYTDAAAYSLTPVGLAQLVFPFLFRTDTNHQWGLWTHWESYLYVGLAPLLLAIVALVCVRRREVAGWGAFGLVGLVLALGQYSPVNLHYWLWLLPGMSGLRAPGRFTLVVVLAAAMLAAHGLSWLQHGARLGMDQPAGLRLRSLLAILCALPVVLAGLLFGVQAFLLAQPDAARRLIDFAYLSQSRDVFPLTTSDVYAGLLWATSLANARTLGAVLSLLVLAGMLLVWQFGPRRRGPTSLVWPGLLVGATVADLVIFGWSIHPRAPLATLSAEPPSARAVGARSNPTDGQPFRVLASPVINQVASDRLALFGFHDANGYSSLESSWHREYLGRVLRTDDQLLDLWNVRYVFDPARFGAIPSFREVGFLPQQPMLQAVRGSSLSDQTFRLGSPTSVVETRLVLSLMDAVDIPQNTPVGDVILRGPDGQVIAQHPLEAGRDVMDWGWDDPRIHPYVQHARVEVAGVAFEGGGQRPDQRLLSFAQFGVSNAASVATVEVRAAPAHGEVAVYGVALVDERGAAHQLLGRSNAKYREVYRDSEVAVLENTAAFSRAFVVSGARPASRGTPLDEMQHKPFQPDTEVIVAPLEVPHELLARLPSPSDEAGEVGSAQIEAYGTGMVRVQASTARDALLVLSDNFYPGWRAFVDGQEQPIVRGDLLFRVVPLPAGRHDVVFRFDPLSFKLGLLVTLASLLLGVGLVAAGWRRR